MENSDTQLENCLISRNTATASGGGVYIRDKYSNPDFLACTIAFNKCGIEGVGVYNGGVGTIVGSVLLNGGTDEIHESETGKIAVSYSNVRGGWPGEGNIDTDPKFRDEEREDFRLLPDSPCIDSASMEGPETDLDGKARPIDVPGVGRDGEGAFDMGAYEYQLLPGDMNYDGVVNHVDLFLFQSQWQE